MPSSFSSLHWQSKRKRRKGRQLGKPASLAKCAWSTLLTIILVFWNPRGIVNKATEFKHFLEDQGAVYAGVSESQTYKESHTLSDAKWNWEEGTETSPSEEGNGVRVARGIGAFTNSEQTKTSIIRKGKYTLWHRLDVQGDNNLAVGTAYFPNAQDIDGHTKANEELRGDFNALSNMGYSMVISTHTRAQMETKDLPMRLATCF